jgi:3-oxoacyl-[acyl-carrier protein] reductase
MRILLTGSSSGIGRELADHLLSAGHQVWGIARSGQDSLGSRHPDGFRSSRCDVSAWEQVSSVASEIAADWGGLDALVTCAGWQGEVGPAIAADPLRWSATVRTNLDGTFFCFRACYPLLSLAQRRARIVFFSGGGASKARPNFSAYAVAKTGVVRLAESLAAELAGCPIDINAVAPGAINTRMTDEVIALGPEIAGESEYLGALAQKSSGGARIQDVLDLVDWLLSPGSDGISGRLISAPWDPWRSLSETQKAELGASDIYMLRRVLPGDRGKTWPEAGSMVHGPVK